jgi:hypothetical protein
MDHTKVVNRWGSAWLVVVLALAVDRPADGSAWSPKKGHGLILWQTYSYRATERFDSDGRREPLGPQASFRSTVLQSWLEAGITDRWTLVVVAPVGRLQYRDLWTSERSFALGDLQAGVRYRLRGSEQGWQVAVQTLGKAPGYSAHARPRPGQRTGGLGRELAAGPELPRRDAVGLSGDGNGFQEAVGQAGGPVSRGNCRGIACDQADHGLRPVFCDSGAGGLAAA